MQSEREAITRFLAMMAALAELERKCRRVERIAVAAYSGALLAGVAIPPIEGFRFLDFLSYGIACGCALALRRWVLVGIQRRRHWRVMQAVAAHARARLADLDRRPRPTEQDSRPTAGASIP